MLLWIWLITAVVVMAVWINSHWRQSQRWELAARRSCETASIVIPALNEEKALQRALEYLRQLDPAALEIIVVDGDSNDSTIATARAGGAKVVTAARGRAIQMNAGAKAAKGDLLCFLHADSRPPVALVHIMRRTLADSRTVLGGFRTLIRTDGGRLLKFLTAHHLAKTYYTVMLGRPLMWLRGGVCLLGDQTMFCRAADFRAVGGYDESLPIMEDAQLCITMHDAGPVMSQRRCKGRIRQVWWPPAETSGRRLEALGNWRATRIHFIIGLGWYCGTSRERLFHLYRTLYSDNHR